MTALGEYAIDGTASTLKHRDYKDATDLIALPINSQVATRHNKMGERTAFGIGEDGDPAFTIGANHHHAIAYGIPSNTIDREPHNGGNGMGFSEQCSPTLTMKDRHAVAFAQNQRGEVRTSDVSPQLTCGGGKPGEGYPAIAYNVTFCDANGKRADRPNGGLYVNEAQQAKTVTSNGDLSTYVASFKPGQSADSRSIGYDEHCTPALEAGGGGNNKPAILSNMVVRRLTPRECERLQGFPDDYTLIPYRNKPKELCPDSPRYKALGNSMAVPVMRWLGERIASVDSLLHQDSIL